MNATAISNNDIVYLHWHFSNKIANCLGFTILRHDSSTGSGVPLPAMVGFPGDKRDRGQRFRDTNVWPVQKFAWKDLFVKRGGTYWYEIVPMLGQPGSLIPNTKLAMHTNSVTVDSKHGNCAVFFNRGIISTQAIALQLPKSSKGRPSSQYLKEQIQKVDSPIRKSLVGELEDGVLTLLNRAQNDGGQCYCALYELSDRDLIQHLVDLKRKLHIVLSNAGEDTETGSGDGDATNQDARMHLHRVGIDIIDRMLKKGHIGHNKFVVYKKTTAQAVLCGSTNWTSTGLCAQSNNSIVFAVPGLAQDYLTYWDRLKADTDKAEESKQLQANDLRSSDKQQRKPHLLTDNSGRPAGNVHVWFSPNTAQKSVPRRKDRNGALKPPPAPPDLAEVFELIDNAKQGVLFLAFIPGKPSIVSKLKEVYDAKSAKRELFYLRGAATSPDPAYTFRVDLYHRSGVSDATVRPIRNPPTFNKASTGVASVAGIFAAFAQWEAEIYSVGHAVIHDKILVIDPFTDASVVVTGSHNLGYKASYANDENMVIIRNNRAVAEAYAAHVLDVYEHYRWRWRIQAPIRAEFDKLKASNAKLKAKKKNAELWAEAVARVGPSVIRNAWQNLNPKDRWQDFYVEHKDFLAAEDNFWSSFGGIGIADGVPKDPASKGAGLASNYTSWQQH